MGNTGLLNSASNMTNPPSSRFSAWGHGLLNGAGIFWDGADAINGILYFMEGNTKLGIEYTLRGLTFYGALIGGPVGAGLILLGIGFNLGFAAQGMAGAIDRAYTDYQNGTLGWHNWADIGLNGLAVAGGLHVGAKSLQRAADMSGPGTIDTPPETTGKGESGKTSTGYTYWSESIQFEGNKVYQRNDLFDPMQVSSWKRNGKTVTGTNIERMADGHAPIGYDGKSVNLHHLLQTPDGPIVEVSNNFHKQYYSTIHMNTGKSPSLINRNEFNKWASKYWMNRSLDFQ